MKEENNIILYQDDNEITRVSVRFADEDLWLTQNQLVDIYQTSKSNVSEHIKHIFEDGELDKTVVVRNFRITTQHGARIRLRAGEKDRLFSAECRYGG